MSVRIHFLAEAQPAQAGEPVVLAPRAALRQRGRRRLRLGGDRRASCAASPCKTGAEMGDRVAIAEGLLGGEALVVGDAEGLGEGRAVQIGGGG